MSIKRAKQVSKGKDKDDSEYVPMGGAKPVEPEKSWAEHMKGKPEEKFVPYALSTKFDKGALINHNSFGKGIVTAVIGTRIEVVFEAGMKKLGHAS